MKKQIIIASIIVVLCFEVALSSPLETLALQTSSSNSPPHSPTNLPSQHPERTTSSSSSSSEINSEAIQPRDIISDTLGPIIKYSLASLYALAGLFFNRGNHLPSPHIIPTSQEDTHSEITSDIPTQRPGQEVIVQGKNNQIFVNGRAKYSNDELLKNGEIQIRIRNGGDVYVNNNLVMRKDPRKKITVVVGSLDYDNVSKFLLQIDPTGYLHYIDNNSTTFLHANYTAEAPNLEFEW